MWTYICLLCRWHQDPAVVNAFYNPNMNDIGKSGDCVHSIVTVLHASILWGLYSS